MKIAIGLLLSHGFPAPTDFWDSYELVMSHIATGEANATLPEHLKIDGIRRFKSTAFPPDVGRNEVCRHFLKSDADYLFFMDCDMTFPRDVIPTLLKHEKAVITARYHMRKPPFSPAVYVKHPFVEGRHAYKTVHFGKGVFEVERGGAGALLIRRDVLEAIQFRIGPNNWFRYQLGPEAEPDMTVSEDFWFYQQAREAGYPVFCDWECECGHLQMMTVNRTWNAAYLDAQIRELPSLSEDKRKEFLDSIVVCGMPDGLTLPTGDHLPAYAYMPGER